MTRTPQILTLHAQGLTDAEISRRLGVVRQTVHQAVARHRRDAALAAAGIAVPADRRGRRPSVAVSHTTARGRALLAQLVTDAAAAGVEPEDHLAAARRSGES